MCIDFFLLHWRSDPGDTAVWLLLLGAASRRAPSKSSWSRHRLSWLRLLAGGTALLVTYSGHLGGGFGWPWVSSQKGWDPDLGR
jgi:hypothetical protein